MRGDQVMALCFSEAPDPEGAAQQAVNGASILYSSEREYLLPLTSRLRWGQLSLPTMSFTDVTLDAER